MALSLSLSVEGLGEPGNASVVSLQLEFRQVGHSRWTGRRFWLVTYLLEEVCSEVSEVEVSQRSGAGRL